ncbi:hypothetical protein DMB42_42075 [Nonomuraea sp. WAC 01424]|uniref:nuclear transport factor 2 family protein n=1 Tax=Nonomuraea sp. WAC 01424 TaxID=2203200 RepID=UPI000F79C8F3|nr:nuclear transport factor 2 family protein [Nonomuraea sp. WAC 01424]RSM99496.1 hypothetical protein DMB42_42075 [Nonomuraea sp. WAC 01424]
MTFPAMPAAVLQFFTASQNADADTWAAAFADDGVFHDPVGPPPITGRAAIHRFIASVLPGFHPFLGLTPLQAHTVGNQVAVSWRGPPSPWTAHRPTGRASTSTNSTTPA